MSSEVAEVVSAWALVLLVGSVVLLALLIGQGVAIFLDAWKDREASDE